MDVGGGVGGVWLCGCVVVWLCGCVVVWCGAANVDACALLESCSGHVNICVPVCLRVRVSAPGVGSIGSYNGTITCTWDGGVTWLNTFNQTSPGNQHGSQILDLRAVGQDWWAIGGYMADYHYNGWVLHSHDNGHTWAVDTELPNVEGECIDVAADGSGALHGVAYYNPGPPTDDTYLDNYDVILTAQ